MVDLSDEVKANYVHMRTLPDGRVCGVHQLLFHWTLHVGIHEFGYEERYCFDTFPRAVVGLESWSGEGDPEGWHRHPESGRRRDLATGREWVDR